MAVLGLSARGFLETGTNGSGSIFTSSYISECLISFSDDGRLAPFSLAAPLGLSVTSLVLGDVFTSLAVSLFSTLEVLSFFFFLSVANKKIWIYISWNTQNSKSPNKQTM